MSRTFMQFFKLSQEFSGIPRNFPEFPGEFPGIPWNFQNSQKLAGTPRDFDRNLYHGNFPSFMKFSFCGFSGILPGNSEGFSQNFKTSFPEIFWVFCLFFFFCAEIHFWIFAGYFSGGFFPGIFFLGIFSHEFFRGLCRR